MLRAGMNSVPIGRRMRMIRMTKIMRMTTIANMMNSMKFSRRLKTKRVLIMR